MYMEQGIESAFEVSTIDMKRDVRKLRQISEETGLKIVCSTGFYLSEYHPAWMNDATKEEIAEIYIRELTEGIDDTGIKAGLIAEIASSPKAFVGNEKKILEAAGIASKKTGFAVSTHTGRINAVETIETLLKEGVDPDKIIIGHQDLIDDPDYHLSLLKYGVNIAFDTCGKVAYMPDETRALNAKKIVDAGYGDHLLLSNDISRHTYFKSSGSIGYLAVMGSVVPKMREYGVSEEDINKFLIDNPARNVVGCEGPEVLLRVECTEVGDAVGCDGDVIKLYGLVEGVGDAGGGDAVLFQHGYNLDVFDGAVVQHRDGERQLEYAQIVLGVIALKIAYHLRRVDGGGVEAGFGRGGVVGLGYHLDAVKMEEGRCFYIAFEFLASAGCQCGQQAGKYNPVIFFRKNHTP